MIAFRQLTQEHPSTLSFMKGSFHRIKQETLVI